MDINQLSEIVKKKILDNELIENVESEDKSFLHKNHKTNNPNKFDFPLEINFFFVKFIYFFTLYTFLTHLSPC